MKVRIRDEVFDLNELLHPADAFEHPSEVVGDPDLTLNEKRAILSSWASDACALEAAPELRELPREQVVRSMTSWTRFGHWIVRRGKPSENIKSLSDAATSSVVFAGPKAAAQLRNNDGSAASQSSPNTFSCEHGTISHFSCYTSNPQD